MANKNIFDLVADALPKDIALAVLKGYGKKEWWEKRPALALAYSLRHCPRINWDAYLAHYPDVCQAGADPVLHFLRNGVFEGRKLKSRHPFFCKPLMGCPDISVIIPSYNNALFLDKCLNSVTRQTLESIEVIVVDDCSTDVSLSVVRKYAHKDVRVKVIQHQSNLGTHMTRKTGVQAATGKYTMFLDADDYFMPDACERARDLAALGHDITVFELNVINHDAAINSPISHSAWFDRLSPGVYESEEKINFSFMDNVLPNFLHNKIFETSFCKACFSRMEDFPGYMYEDMYEFLVLNYFARDIYKTNDILTNYRIGTGVSTLGAFAAFAKNINRHISVLDPFNRFCREHSLYGIAQYFNEFLLRRAVTGLSEFDACTRGKIFKYLACKFNSCKILYEIYKLYKNDIMKLLEFIPDISNVNENISRNKISLMMKNLSISNNIYIAVTLGENLSMLGYDVSFICDEKSEYDESLSEKFNIYYSSEFIDNHGEESSFSARYAVLSRAMPSYLIDFSGKYSELSVTITICKYMRIKLIALLDLDHNFNSLYRSKNMPESIFIKQLQCLDRVICSNISSELYLRSHGIDAACVCLPPQYNSTNIVQQRRYNFVAFMGSVDNRRMRPFSSLHILLELMKYIPDVRFIYQGNVRNAEAMKKFLAEAAKLGVSNAVEFADITKADVLAQCKLLLSCAFIEGFAQWMATAQANGLPIVMYDTEVSMMEDNQAVIRVAQGDVKNAALAIAELLNNEDKRQSLAKIARERAAGLSGEKFRASLKCCIGSCGTSSPWHPRTQAEYARAIRYMVFYGGREMPAFAEV